MMDEPVFESMLSSHGSEIFAFLWRMVGDGTEAEDCLQETFLRAFKAFPRLEAGANHRAWLYAIANNVARTYLKRRAGSDARMSVLEEDRPDGGASVEGIVERRQELEFVRRAVRTLPHKQWAALMLRKYHGLEYSEIAGALGCSEASARANVYQGLKRLRTLIAREPQRVEQ